MCAKCGGIFDPSEPWVREAIRLADLEFYNDRTAGRHQLPLLHADEYVQEGRSGAVRHRGPGGAFYDKEKQ